MTTFGTPPAKKKRTRLGVPPEVDEASTTLEAPEHAPVGPKSEAPRQKHRSKTGRTVTFGTRVSQEFDEAFRELAFREKKKHVELLEDMLRVYQKHKS